MKGMCFRKLLLTLLGCLFLVFMRGAARAQNTNICLWVSAFQMEDGTDRVQVDYTVDLYGDLESVEVAVWVICDGYDYIGGILGQMPSASGDIGGDNITSGTYQIIWDFRQYLWNRDRTDPFFTSNAKIRVYGACGYEEGDIVYVDSDYFGMAAYGAGIFVHGAVMDSSTLQPLSGCTVTLAGATNLTTADGAFSFHVDLAEGNTLVVSKNGYATDTQSVLAPVGATNVTIPNIYLPVNAGNAPKVSSLQSSHKGIFLETGSSLAPLDNTYTASVEWNNLTPGKVQFYANDTLVTEATGSGPTYTCSLNIDDYFSASYKSGANKMKVVAIDAGGWQSSPYVMEVALIPFTIPISLHLGPDLSIQFDPATWQFDVGCIFPDQPVHAELELPVLGLFGADFIFNAGFGYTPWDSGWVLTLGAGGDSYKSAWERTCAGNKGKSSGPMFDSKLGDGMVIYFGDSCLPISFQVSADGTATPSDGIKCYEVIGTASISLKIEVAQVSLIDLLAPGTTEEIREICPKLADLLNPISIGIWVLPEMSGELTIGTYPSVTFKNAEITGSCGVEVGYEPKIADMVSMSAYIRGTPSITFDLTGDFAFKDVNFKALAGFNFTAWLLQLGPYEYVFVNVTYPSSSLTGAPALSRDMIETRRIFRNPPKGGLKWRALDRPYLDAGPEKFVGNDQGEQVVTKDGETVTVADAFRAMNRRPVRGSVKGKSMSKRSELSPALSQVDVTLYENTFSLPAQRVARHGQELMVVHVLDNENTNALQFTDIGWTRYDGTNWNTVGSIQTNTQADLDPQVAFDGDGDAIAVWSQVKDTNFSTVDITALAAELETVYSRWDRSSSTWSIPEALTTNSYVDHSPLLCGPVSGGDLLLTWVKNESNLLMGTGSLGTVANDQVLWNRWDAGTHSWGTTATLISNQTYRLSQDLEGISNCAAYVWTRNADNTWTNGSELCYRLWTNSAWGAAATYVTDNSTNRNARAAVSTNGDIYVVWQKETNLVMDVNFSGTSSLVRGDSHTAGFEGYELTPVGPEGHLALIWHEMNEDSSFSDPYYSVYDPVSGTWGHDARLFESATVVERHFNVDWNSAGNLVAAYNRVEMLTTSTVVTAESGESLTFTNIPVNGQVDVGLVTRALITDLAINEGDFTIDGNNYQPNENITLSARVRNIGDVAVSNVVVAFYDGNPVQGGTFLTNATATQGWYRARATNAVATAEWVIPDPATNRTLYAVATASSVDAEFSWTDNQQAVSIGGVDLGVTLVKAQAQRDGSIQVVARVQNGGTPGALGCDLAIWRTGETDTLLGTTDVPSLEPGRIAQVDLDLPAGTQPKGTNVFYRLVVDGDNVTGDVNTTNNTVTFAYLLPSYAPCSYGGSGSSDLVIYDNNTGCWYILSLDGTLRAWGTPWGWPGAVAVPGDYDGDGVSDLAVFDDTSGYWYIMSLDGTLIAWATSWGWAGAVPVPGDYDGDGVSDLAVFDDTSGNWYIATLAGGVLAWALEWGWAGAVPVMGDYNGDRVSDLAVFDDQTTGTWYIRTLDERVLVWAAAWGWAGAVPVTGDYNGDGINDLAVFDSTGAYWYILSLDGELIALAAQWGWPGADPVAGDYNGDGIYDLAFFDEGSGYWYIMSLDGNVLAWAAAWGWAGAVPVGADGR